MNLRSNPEWQKAQRGELYTAFLPELIVARARCSDACHAFNTSTDSSRRNRIRLWRAITDDHLPLPPPAPTQMEDDELLKDEAWVEPPSRADYGVNVFLKSGAFINANSTFIDTCPITIGERVLIGPNCSFYAGSHPVDPVIRNGLKGPESGRPIVIENDCWLGGNVIVLQGVTIGRGSTVGAGSVVTRDVPPFHIVAGNPARILRKITSSLETEHRSEEMSEDLRNAVTSKHRA